MILLESRCDFYGSNIYVGEVKSWPNLCILIGLFNLKEKVPNVIIFCILIRVESKLEVKINNDRLHYPIIQY